MWPQDKKGVSIMIGYVLLISMAVIIGAIVYQWMNTYVPEEELECPDSVSVLVSDLSCVTQGNNWNLEFKVQNNGRFSVGGFFVSGGKTGDGIATIPFSDYEINGNNGAIFLLDSFDPNEKVTLQFTIPKSNVSEFSFIEITPLRFQEEDNKKRIASCGASKIKENVVCIN